MEFPTAIDGAVYQQAFTSAVQIGVMTKDIINVRDLLTACDGASLDRVVAHLTHGTAHHHVKIDEVCEMVEFVVAMKRVITLTENAMNKFKKLMSAKLWLLGCVEVGGQFKMDTLVSFIRGVRVLK